MTACIIGMAVCCFILGTLFGAFLVFTLTANKKPVAMPDGNAERPVDVPIKVKLTSCVICCRGQAVLAANTCEECATRLDDIGRLGIRWKGREASQ